MKIEKIIEWLGRKETGEGFSKGTDAAIHAIIHSPSYAYKGMCFIKDIIYVNFWLRKDIYFAVD